MINGESAVSPGRGLNMVAYYGGKTVLSRTYDTYDSVEESEKFADDLMKAKAGAYIAVVAYDDAKTSLDSTAMSALKSIGGTKIDSLSFRGSYAFLSKKGSGKVYEKVSDEKTVTVTADYNC